MLWRKQGQCGVGLWSALAPSVAHGSSAGTLGPSGALSENHGRNSTRSLSRQLSPEQRQGSCIRWCPMGSKIQALRMRAASLSLHPAAVLCPPKPQRKVSAWLRPRSRLPSLELMLESCH
ncbi:unnamed protein product [Rangifer tarandus platyrhynchus]|uniref:Uncharacterized protein n=1 Tax=Rangifer tarandus platyrhynchus TaxID=3082113 RepID=A0AC59ZQZ5_RANTA